MLLIQHGNGEMQHLTVGCSLWTVRLLRRLHSVLSERLSNWIIVCHIKMWEPQCLKTELLFSFWIVINKSLPIELSRRKATVPMNSILCAVESLKHNWVWKLIKCGGSPACNRQQYKGSKKIVFLDFFFFFFYYNKDIPGHRVLLWTKMGLGHELPFGE